MGGVTGQAITIDTVFEDDRLRVTQSGDSEAAKVILCFTGIGFKMGGPGMSPEQFIGTLAMPDQLVVYVTDLERSWYNGFPRDHLLSRLEPLVAGREVTTIGSSMGAFGAIWISRYLPVRTAIAFGPQFSVKSDIVPTERRWAVLRSKIKDWRVESLDGHFMDRTHYYTFGGQVDRVHLERFPTGPNITHCFMPEAGHLPPQLLKEMGLLRGLVQQCLDHRDAIGWLASHGIDAYCFQQADCAT